MLNDADKEVVSSGNIFLTPSARDRDVLTAQQFEPIGTLADCDIDWLYRTGGIVDFAVPEKARRLIDDHPVAILLPAAHGGYPIALRETVAGLWVRAKTSCRGSTRRRMVGRGETSRFTRCVSGGPTKGPTLSSA